MKIVCTKDSLRQYGRRGFSLIEVMVATAIFLLIVSLIGGMFRQASSAWETGATRASGGMVVRGVVGSIQRELAEAVDGRWFASQQGGVWNANDPAIIVQNSNLRFICIKNPTGPADNGLRLVEYTWGGGKMEREAWFVDYNATSASWARGMRDGDKAVLYSEESGAMYRGVSFKFSEANLSDISESPRNFEKVRDPKTGMVFSDEIYWNVPAVVIDTELTRDGSFSGLEVRSYGRNGVPDADAAGKNDDLIAN